MADRLDLLERYHSRWDKLQGDGWRRITLPTHNKRVLEGDILGCIEESGDDRLDAHFIQLPSVSREVRLKQWVVRGLPRCNVPLKVNPEVDLLVVPEVVIEGLYVFSPLAVCMIVILDSARFGYTFFGYLMAFPTIWLPWFPPCSTLSTSQRRFYRVSTSW